jgi:hypothetical protein
MRLRMPFCCCSGKNYAKLCKKTVQLFAKTSSPIQNLFAKTVLEITLKSLNKKKEVCDVPQSFKVNIFVSSLLYEENGKDKQLGY